MRLAFPARLVFAATVLLTACGGSGGGDTTAPPTPAAVASVAVSGSTAPITVGATVQLTATPSDAAGRALSGRAITWSSGSANVATVNSAGLVTAVGPGNATITATSEGINGSATITVVPVPIALVVLTAPKQSMVVGEASQYVAQAKDAQGNTLAGRTVTWTSAQPAIAAVSASGLVTALTAGTTTISASSEGINSAAITVTVSLAPVATVTVSAPKLSLLIGETSQFVAQMKDAQGNALTGRTVSWSSSQPTIASVSASGVITALSAGTTAITATSEGISSATTTVTVTRVPIATITISAPKLALVVGETSAYNAQAKDAQGNVLTGRTVAWSSSSTTVASVSATGVVTALAPGAATITATSESVNGSVAITVTQAPVASVSIVAPNSTFAVGDVSQLTAQLKDAQGNALAGRVVTWRSTQPTVATVSASGLVTAVGIGATSITATSESITSTAITINVGASSVLLEQRVLAQQGLAIALASTVLQSQLYTLIPLVIEADDTGCLAMPGGGALKTLSSTSSIPFQIGFYFDTACQRIYMRETVTTFTADNVGHNYHIIANAIYTGPTGTPLGSIAFDEFANNVSLNGTQLRGTVHGLGTYTSLVGAPSVRLGLNCDLGAAGHNIGVCQGGIAQDFPELGTAYGSVTTLALDSTNAGVLSLAGASQLTTGALGGLTLTQPTALTMVVNGGTVYGTTTDTGGAGNFSLFPPTPTGWTVTDAAHDQVFAISVVDNTVRNLSATLKRISTGATLASITLDQSGTGTITYSDGSRGAITSWMLSR